MMVSEFPEHLWNSPFALGIKKDITNKLRHRKCVRLEMSINTYLEELGKEIIQKANMITIFRT